MNELTIALAFPVGTFALYWVLLSIVRHIYRPAALTAGWVLRTALLLAACNLALILLTALLGGNLLATWIGGDPGLGGLIFLGGIDLALSLVITFVLSLLVLRPTQTTLGQRVKIGLLLALLLPVLTVGIVLAQTLPYYIPQMLKQAEERALTIRGAPAQALVVEYKLPALFGVEYDEFHREAKHVECYSASLHSAMDDHGTGLPWREWTEKLADEAVAGLTAAGYQVQRRSGELRRVYTGQDSVELADIVILGKQGDRFVHYIFPYRYIETWYGPRFSLRFGVNGSSVPSEHR